MSVTSVDRYAAGVAAWSATKDLLSLVALSASGFGGEHLLLAAFLLARGVAYLAVLPGLWRGAGGGPRTLTAALFAVSAVGLTMWHVLTDPVSLQVSLSLLQVGALAGWGVAKRRASTA
ncbi:MAG: hypothetical protein H6732_00680 [Alphaproteobacteria bacterium]|nr:hypothetical protein [Alphaproteobacteria bacterium]